MTKRERSETYLRVSAAQAAQDYYRDEDPWEYLDCLDEVYEANSHQDHLDRNQERDSVYAGEWVRMGGIV